MGLFYRLFRVSLGTVRMVMDVMVGTVRKVAIYTIPIIRSMQIPADPNRPIFRYLLIQPAPFLTARMLSETMAALCERCARRHFYIRMAFHSFMFPQGNSEVLICEDCKVLHLLLRQNRASFKDWWRGHGNQLSPVMRACPKEGPHKPSCLSSFCHYHCHVLGGNLLFLDNPL